DMHAIQSQMRQISASTGVEVGLVQASNNDLKALGIKPQEGMLSIVKGGPDRITFGGLSDVSNPVALSGHTHVTGGFTPSSFDWEAMATINQTRSTMGLAPQKSSFILDVPTGYVHNFGSQTMSVPSTPLPVGHAAPSTMSITQTGGQGVSVPGQLPYGSFAQAGQSGVRNVSFIPAKSTNPARRMNQRVSTTWDNNEESSYLSNDAEPVYLAVATTPATAPAEDTISENAVAGLIAAVDAPYNVAVSNGTVSCPKSSCVFIRDRGRDVGIYVFEKGAREDVVYRGKNGHFTKLKPGRFLIVTSGHDVTAADVNPVLIFGVRGTEEIPLGKEYKAFTGDFSIFAACAELPHFRRMLKSNKASERNLANGILKNVAILGQITAGDGPYKPLR
ncbi:MAG: hypothetical protein K2X29_09830, partial [Candidatus Obscuribacterales bacterium]|nr:hypothetical protein [Candidatus Obscuribacterales bacterium]